MVGAIQQHVLSICSFAFEQRRSWLHQSSLFTPFLNADDCPKEDDFDMPEQEWKILSHSGNISTMILKVGLEAAAKKASFQAPFQS